MYAFINEVNGKKLNQTNEDIATRLECIEWVSLKLVHFDSFWSIMDSGPFLVHYGPFQFIFELKTDSVCLKQKYKIYILACCRCCRKIQKKKETPWIQSV